MPVRMPALTVPSGRALWQVNEGGTAENSVPFV